MISVARGLSRIVRMLLKKGINVPLCLRWQER